ncbi:hypothetical protein K488DRAFT_32141, partial [Vararia minispora EC-137]
LDADLYGDLYGNDDVSPSTQTTHAISQPSTTNSIATQSSTSTVKNEASPLTPVHPVAKQEAPTPIAPATNSIPTYDSTAQDIAPEPSLIPTYTDGETGQPKFMPPPRDSGSYEDLAAKERSVRPSEMKDEG